MSIKSFAVILVLSVVVTYLAAFIDDLINISKNPTGLPFPFASFNFFGGSNNLTLLILDIIFWFVIIFIVWKLISRFLNR